MRNISRMRKALREIECWATSTLAHQGCDDNANQQALKAALVGIKTLCSRETQDECVPDRVNEKPNPAIMTNREAAALLGCSPDAIKRMKTAKRHVGVSFGAKRHCTRYVTRESVERVMRGEA